MIWQQTRIANSIIAVVVRIGGRCKRLAADPLSVEWSWWVVGSLFVGSINGTTPDWQTAGRGNVLEGLNEVPWASLRHAYGPAMNTPEHLPNLASFDAWVQEEAYDNLSYSIHHQGSICPAAVANVPSRHLSIHPTIA